MKKHKQSDQENIANLCYSQQGSILIYLVAVLVVAGALGAGIVSLTTSSTFTELTYNPSDRARYLAMSGVNYGLFALEAEEDILNLDEYDWQNSEPILLTMSDNEEIDISFHSQEVTPGESGIVRPRVISVGRVFPGSTRESQFRVDRDLWHDEPVSISWSHHAEDLFPSFDPSPGQSFSFKVWIRDESDQSVEGIPRRAFTFDCDGCWNPEDIVIESIVEGTDGMEPGLRQGPYYLVTANYNDNNCIEISVSIFDSSPISTTYSSTFDGSGTGVEINCPE
ncbi:hypothetical protein [Desulfonatronovibrio magnus]|uniref:hypothetical protein n=1 Tax=Desulfonatronovibrio magnus TaxID=698827 RepID=UPI0005EBBC8B|nr:hypothetical protein [Desulfonatronovibrio magnus]